MKLDHLLIGIYDYLYVCVCVDERITYYSASKHFSNSFTKLEGLEISRGGYMYSTSPLKGVCNVVT